ncbi:transposable element Tc1 transposase [Trichonephila clavipes]|nr:transposable element Tc1 transposase [Trichonephila clavipes]
MMGPLEDTGKNGWTVADFSVMKRRIPFQLCPENHRQRVWRHLGERAYSAFTIARYTGPKTGVMVWGAISFDNRTPLGVNRGALTAQRYFDDILRVVLLPFLLPWPYFQQDNAKPHTARVAMNCRTACQTLPWPTNSLDLSSIVHIWDMIGRRLHLLWNVDDLTRQLEKICNSNVCLCKILIDFVLALVIRCNTPDTCYTLNCPLRGKARSRVTAPVEPYLETLNWEILLLPPYSPDIAVSDYRWYIAFFCSKSYEDIKNWLDSWISSKEEALFRYGTHMLPEGWRKVVASNGE